MCMKSVCKYFVANKYRFNIGRIMNTTEKPKEDGRNADTELGRRGVIAVVRSRLLANQHVVVLTLKRKTFVILLLSVCLLYTSRCV